VLAKRVRDDLQVEFDAQKEALNSPQQFRAWVHENYSVRAERVLHGGVEWLGALPIDRLEKVNFLLDSGFDPVGLEFIRDIAFDFQRDRCETLKTKFNIKLGRSAYAPIVVDFWGILEPGEVHMGFSTAFNTVDGESITLLHGMDVLVGRAPAHFASDIQRVKAVFKPELQMLKVRNTSTFLP
jgi:hypothetical protein